MRLNDVLDRKQTFFKKKFQSLKNGIFPKGLEIRLNDVLDRKQTFLTTKTKFFNVSKIAFFQRG